MKKITVIALLLFSVFILSGCEDTPVEVELNCDIYPTHKSCTKDNVEPGETDPLNPNGNLPTNGVYINEGKGSSIVFDGRELVPDSCTHLDNVGEWQPIWCDEFEYQGLPNNNLWKYDVGGNGWGNNELQYYTDGNLDNAFVDNGVLTIKAIKENYNGSTYTSARLITKETGDFLYGKIQVRAKVPGGKGTWPAIWMLPTDWEYGGWPTSGEIDIMEYVGYQNNVIHGTIHTGLYNHMLNTQVGKSFTVQTAEEEFHVYEMEWEPGIIILYVDGIEYARFEYDNEKSVNEESFEAWPFDKDFHLLLNLAIGGNWGGAQGVDPTLDNQEFVVDYVRVYQKDYSGMDDTAPSVVTGLSIENSTVNSMFITWDNGIDDILVKEYEIYVDDVLLTTTTVNGHLITGLDMATSYNIKIISVDFAGQKSGGASLDFSTSEPQVITSIIDVENYVTMSGVTVEQTSDYTGGYNVGFIDDGDYMTYVLNVEESGHYTMDVRYASKSSGLSLALKEGSTTLVHVDAAATYGWQTWNTTTSDRMYLNEGIYTFTLTATGSGYNLNYIQFKKVE